MNRLPLDIIEIILSRLPIQFSMRLRCVCKSWFALTHHPYFINMHLNQSSQQNPSLILNTTVCTDATHFRSQLCLADSQHLSCNEIRFSQPNFDEFRVADSCNGLLCLVHRVNPKSICICNPCTGDRIKIPEFHSAFERKYITDVVFGGFGFSRKTNEYKVVVVVIYGRRGGLLEGDDVEKKSSGAYVCNLGDGFWRYAGTPPLGITGDSNLRAFVDGVLHWATDSFYQTIICFDVADGVFREIFTPAVGLAKGDHSLVVLSGFLAVVEYSDDYNRIVIWFIRDHNVTDSWERGLTINFNRVGWNFRYIRVLCAQKDGEILMEYNNHALLSYNVHTTSFRKLSIAGLPSWFEAVCHVGSLVSPLGCLGSN